MWLIIRRRLAVAARRPLPGRAIQTPGHSTMSDDYDDE
jgi:hypothetical protein